MFEAVLTLDVTKFAADLQATAKAIKNHEVVALNRTLSLAKFAVRDAIKKNFTNPTPWVQNSVILIPAKFSQPEPVGIISIGDTRDGEPAWAKANISKQKRQIKRIEKSLARGGEGQAIRSGQFPYMVPTNKMRLDKYGNINRTVLSKIASDIVGASKAGYSAKTKRASWRVGYTKRGRPMLFNDNISPNRPLIVFVKKTSYKRRLDFVKIVSEVWDKNIQAEIDKAFKEALTGSFMRN